MSKLLTHTCDRSPPAPSPDPIMTTPTTYLLHQTSCSACHLSTNTALDRLTYMAPPPSPSQGPNPTSNGPDNDLQQAIHASLLTLRAQNRAQPSSNASEDFMMSGGRSPGIPAAEQKTPKGRAKRNEKPLDAMARGEWDSDFEQDGLSDWEAESIGVSNTRRRPPPPPEDVDHGLQFIPPHVVKQPFNTQPSAAATARDAGSQRVDMGTYEHGADGDSDLHDDEDPGRITRQLGEIMAKLRDVSRQLARRQRGRSGDVAK